MLYLIEILHQTTTLNRARLSTSCCILSKFYIKPQQANKYIRTKQVVSYRNSTSNHNRPRVDEKRPRVVSYRNSTSNHNLWTTKSASEMLYLIEILHQTTTDCLSQNLQPSLYLIEILHQTTTFFDNTLVLMCCILSKFYIKPQLRRQRSDFRCVVSYRNSTSNHNIMTALLNLRNVVSYRNSTSNHNKHLELRGHYGVVSYRNSTSNHNIARYDPTAIELYLIEILHQTTTRLNRSTHKDTLYLIEILHQTTTSGLILIDKVLLTGCLPL